MENIESLKQLDSGHIQWALTFGDQTVFRTHLNTQYLINWRSRNKIYQTKS